MVVLLKQRQGSYSGTYQAKDKMIDSVCLHPNNTLHVNTSTDRQGGRKEGSEGESGGESERDRETEREIERVAIFTIQDTRHLPPILPMYPFMYSLSNSWSLFNSCNPGWLELTV